MKTSKSKIQKGTGTVRCIQEQKKCEQVVSKLRYMSLFDGICIIKLYTEGIHLCNK